MKVQIPEADVDELMTREDFDNALRVYVNSENKRILTASLTQVEGTQQNVAALMLPLITIMPDMSEEHSIITSNVITAVVDALITNTNTFKSAVNEAGAGVDGTANTIH